MRIKHSPVVLVLISVLLILHSSLSALAGISFIVGEGVVLTGAGGVLMPGADGVLLTGPDGVVLTGAGGVVLTGAGGVVFDSADAVTYTGVELAQNTVAQTGIRSFDPELAWLLDTLPDSSFVNVFVVFHHMPTESDFAALTSAGIVGGTIFDNLPMVLTNATKYQIEAISHLPSVRTIYSNKTIEFFTNDTRAITGQGKVVTDQALTNRNGGVPLSGAGVTVAVLDTGIDASHPDLSFGSHVVRNVRVADLQGSAPVFIHPNVIDGGSNTDLAMGHGTFVAGVIAGTGSASGGYYGGIAPGARLLGVSCGDANLSYVLSGIDYILSHREEQNIRVVNCSFGINGVFDANDPVNIATRIMHDAGISVVFSAGNRGEQPNSLNPYGVADWVVGVGSVGKNGSLSGFSSRGAAAYGTYHPTLVAPGEAIVSARASGINVVGTAGLANSLISPQGDLQHVPPAYLASYTCSSGTSFAAPHVAGTIALMLEADPGLTPDGVKRILQQTATPMLSYSRYEVGAGSLNTYAAVRKAEFGSNEGRFRDALRNPGVSYSRESIETHDGSVAPGSTCSRSFSIPSDAVFATVQIGWLQNNAAGSVLSSAITGPAGTIGMLAPSAIGVPVLKKTGVTINDPAPGSWTINVTNVGTAGGGAQNLVIAVEIIRAHYSIQGLDSLSASDCAAAKRALRTALLTDRSGSFAGDSPATRLEVARALMLASGSRIPQYLPGVPTFLDEPADGSEIFIESVTSSPFGNLMGAVGPNFNPQAQMDRVTVAVGLVKALNLNIPLLVGVINPGLTDWYQIPVSARGYVSIALLYGLMRATNGQFRPSQSITRTELAGAAVALQQATR